MKRLSAAVSLAILMCACDSSPTSPGSTSSGTSSSGTLSATYTLSGAVSEVTPDGQAPVAAVRVVANGLVAMTDNEGLYTISNLRGGLTYLNLSKEGYDAATEAVTIAADTRVDIQIVRRVSYTLSGVVSEVTPTGLAPVEGVLIEEMSCHADDSGYDRGCRTYIFEKATTDKNGFYSLAGLYSGKNNYVWVSKAGYQADGVPEATPCDGCIRILTINGDTRFDIQLVRR